MHRVFRMVGKDLLRQRRSPMAIGFVLAFPIIFSALLALAFGGDGGNGFPRVRLLIEDRDGSTLSGFLVSAAGSEQIAEYFEITNVGDEGQSLIDEGKASALLLIPEGFGANLLAGEPIDLTLVRNPAESILPEIAEQGLTVLADLLDSASHVLREPLSELNEMTSAGAQGPTSDDVAAMAVSVHGIVARAEALVAPPAIRLVSVDLGEQADAAEPADSSTSALVFILVLPGISVWALFLLGDMAMRDVLVEAKLGTLRRQLSGPIHPWEIVVGKSLFTAALATISLVLLTSIGWAFTSRVVDPAGFAVLSTATVLAVTGYAAVVYGIARTERQGATISSIVLLAFAFMGGAFLPVDSLPAAARRFAPISPFYWGTTGYKALILDGGALTDVLTPVGILAALGVVLLTAGSWLLGRKVAGGLGL